MQETTGTYARSKYHLHQSQPSAIFLSSFLVLPFLKVRLMFTGARGSSFLALNSAIHLLMVVLLDAMGTKANFEAISEAFRPSMYDIKQWNFRRSSPYGRLRGTGVIGEPESFTVKLFDQKYETVKYKDAFSEISWHFRTLLDHYMHAILTYEISF